MKLFLKISCLSLIATGLLLAGGHYAQADANATDFENFTPGDVNGQNGWTSGHGSTFCPVYDVAVVPNTFGYSAFGTQSLRLSNAITCGSFNDQTFSPSLTNEAGETTAGSSTYSGGVRQPYFEAQWNFASTVPGSAQPGLSVVASADRGDTMRMSWLQMLDTPDNVTGLTLNFEDYDHSIMNFTTVPIATHLDRTVPHTVKITIQFIDGAGNDIVNIYLDGTLIHTGTTWEDYYRDFAGGIPFPIDSIMFREAGTAVPATLGQGFLIDNFSSFSGPVPSLLPPPAPPSSFPRTGTITVVKMVTNAKGGTKTPADFPLFVNGMQVDSGTPNIFPAPADLYQVTETTDPDYASVFSGDCDTSGDVSLGRGDNKICLLTNTYIGPTTAIVTPIPPLIDVVKMADPLTLPDGPGPVTYTYTLKNIGTVPVTNMTLSSDTCNPMKLIAGDLNSNNILDMNEVWTYRCSMTLTATRTNTVIATGRANGLTTTDIESITVMVGTPLASPVIHVTVTPYPLTLPDDGGSVTYRAEVTNPGTVPLGNISLTDNVCNKMTYISGDTNNDFILDHSETWIYACQVSLIKTLTDTSIVSGTGGGSTTRDIALATVIVAAPAATLAAPIKMIKINLTQGMSGNEVKVLQNFLMLDNAEADDVAARALTKAGATGYFGPLTRAALIDFQTDAMIAPPLGRFGPLTRAYINNHY